MHFIFAKLYEAYLKNNKVTASISITGYISVIYFMLSFSPMALFCYWLEDYYHLNDNVAEYVLLSIIIVTAGSILYFTNRYYIKKGNIDRLKNRYSKIKFSNLFLYPIIALLPVAIMLISAIALKHIRS